jgi:hypothetical protein
LEVGGLLCGGSNVRIGGRLLVCRDLRAEVVENQSTQEGLIVGPMEAATDDDHREALEENLECLSMVTIDGAEGPLLSGNTWRTNYVGDYTCELWTDFVGVHVEDNAYGPPIARPVVNVGLRLR